MDTGLPKEDTEALVDSSVGNVGSMGTPARMGEGNE